MQERRNSSGSGSDVWNRSVSGFSLHSDHLQQRKSKDGIGDQAMSLARIHDKYKLRSFWEQKIERHSQMMGNEESRMRRSALSKLREEWLWRLQSRNQHLNECMKEERLQKAQRVQEFLGLQRSN